MARTLTTLTRRAEQIMSLVMNAVGAQIERRCGAGLLANGPSRLTATEKSAELFIPPWPQGNRHCECAVGRFLLALESANSMDSERLNTVVQSILAGCFTAEDPVAYLSAEIERLRLTGEWSELELRRVQELALGTAKALVAR